MRFGARQRTVETYHFKKPSAFGAFSEKVSVSPTVVSARRKCVGQAKTSIGVRGNFQMLFGWDIDCADAQLQVGRASSGPKASGKTGMPALLPIADKPPARKKFSSLIA